MENSMNQRFCALASIQEGFIRKGMDHERERGADDFGAYVFNRQVMQKMLPGVIFQNVCNAMDGMEPIKQEYADTIAVAMKEWALSLGATHFSHWFHPLTGFSAEKHDAFIEWNSADQVIEKFSGKQLIQGEPDASSFPSGGLRSTFEARGYTGWDPTSPAFIWKAGDGTTLCIPSVYFSWTGDVLDSKIPLLRSIRRLNTAVLSLLKLTGIAATRIDCTVGLEQEYFIIDRRLYTARPDLMLTGRTVQGACPSKGQELQDHYFGAVKDRVLSFMHHFETEALKLGIPVKTRHNEVAPAQHEVAPVVEKGSVALDHNIQLMELMRKVAVEHNLAVLLHEKPFKDFNGSGKHCNWSLATESGINLLDPTDTPENNLHFLVLLTAIVHAVHKHAPLLRASIGSSANDNRLGGHEAPPAIISMYLGKELEDLLENIESKGSHAGSKIREKYDLGLSVIPMLSKDNTDRNRTSPLAFTGNKFEFRAVGASQNAAIPVTVLNVIVAESLEEILLEIGRQESLTRDELILKVLPVLQKKLKGSRPIRFYGDNYAEAWVKEAKKRGLANLQKSPDAFEAILSPATFKVFQGILSKQELESRYEIALESYCHHIHIEAKLLKELFQTQIYPAALKQQALFAHSSKGKTKQAAYANEYDRLVEEGLDCLMKLQKTLEEAAKEEKFKLKAKKFSDKVLPAMEAFREVLDQLEQRTDDELWQLPKYRELLFLI
jgi:glutamine synthetase